MRLYPCCGHSRRIPSALCHDCSGCAGHTYRCQYLLHQLELHSRQTKYAQHGKRSFPDSPSISYRHNTDAQSMRRLRIDYVLFQISPDFTTSGKIQLPVRRICNSYKLCHFQHFGFGPFTVFYVIPFKIIAYFSVLSYIGITKN